MYRALGIDFVSVPNLSMRAYRAANSFSKRSERLRNFERSLEPLRMIAGRGDYGLANTSTCIPPGLEHGPQLNNH